MIQNKQLTNYADNTDCGEQYGHLVDVQYNIRYPLGRRDLVIFGITDSSGEKSLIDTKGSPCFAVGVCNHSKGISSKSKINLISRCLIREEHKISKFESFVRVPPIEAFFWNKNKINIPYKLIIENRTVNNKTVSNVSHIHSYLYGGFQSIEQQFDTKKEN